MIRNIVSDGGGDEMADRQAGGDPFTDLRRRNVQVGFFEENHGIPR